MNDDAVPRFGKGVKFRRDANGSAMLLVPETALELNASAAAALELVDGARSFRAIVDAITDRFEVNGEVAREEVGDLFERLTERGFIRE
ncbi:MAG TPA: pyrroloquinoline quinone biosynthesis peptide chaperone PqqD [Candidatus Cybelea sp.]|jgi:coenzyme PQQ biosynthesis protein PqqD|nr:pyrroloquinoline quinone biosynthesis peptide chaperone PqqD [Candidatus Cybelea sp.]